MDTQYFPIVMLGRGYSTHYIPIVQCYEEAIVHSIYPLASLGRGYSTQYIPIVMLGRA